ncbi:hypothetical protein B7494_g7449 [Chlorociboria aeruginascens]|nr:hypothetical protein B7494_g7449 [Chlorociboria aeruginascens]
MLFSGQLLSAGLVKTLVTENGLKHVVQLAGSQTPTAKALMSNSPGFHSYPVPVPPSFSMNEVIQEPQKGREAEEDDISPLDYARQSGIACNYLHEPSPLSYLENTEQALLNDFLGDSSLPQFTISADVNLDERLTISRDGACILASVSKEMAAANSLEQIEPSFIGHRELKSIQIETPLLRSDHDNDIRLFARRESFEIKLKDLDLPLERVNVEENEGLSFPSKLWNLSEETLVTLQHEKLEVTRDTLVYLQDTLKNDLMEVDDQNLWISLSTYKRSHALEHLTPPLSPLPLPPPSPYVPNSAECELPILSDPPSLIGAELKAIEEEAFRNDIPTPARDLIYGTEKDSSNDSPRDYISLGDIYSPLASLNSATISSENAQLEDLKVEGPLTPLRPLPETPRTVHFSDSITKFSPIAISELSQTNFFEEAFGEAAEKAKQQSEQEKLLAADLTARVDEPTMDFSRPNPPWKKFHEQRKPETLQELQKVFMRENISPALPRWKDTQKIEAKLPWVPFPSNLAKVALEEETRETDRTWESMIKDDEIISTSELTWKPSGLRILNEDEDDDDETDAGTFERDGPLDMSYLLKRRRMEIEERETSTLTDMETQEVSESAPAPIPQSPEPITTLPTPAFSAPSESTCIIVSSSFLKHRVLIRHLNTHIPKLVLFERDFTAHNTSEWNTNSITRSPIPSPLASEADLIISPSTGIILTTLQKIKQKPLPGQKSKVAIRARLEDVSTRYEKLIVLISESRPDGTTHLLMGNDSLSLAEFLGFAAGFETNITVHFVGGGEEVLSHWLASLIIYHRVPHDGNGQLLEDETHWELFLRRAGMNAFGAQAVLASLRAPEGVNAQGPSKSGLFGLTAFVEMGIEERVERFGGICGERVIRFVSAVVDGRW